MLYYQINKLNVAVIVHLQVRFLNEVLFIYLVLNPQITQYIFFHFKLFIYSKYLSIVLSFFSDSSVENKFVWSTKLLPFGIKSINAIQKYQHVTASCALYYDIFVSYYFLNLFWNMFNSQVIKIYCIITYDSHIKLSGEFLLIQTHQDLLHMPDPLF